MGVWWYHHNIPTSIYLHTVSLDKLLRKGCCFVYLRPGWVRGPCARGWRERAPQRCPTLPKSAQHPYRASTRNNFPTRKSCLYGSFSLLGCVSRQFKFLPHSPKETMNFFLYHSLDSFYQNWPFRYTVTLYGQRLFLMKFSMSRISLRVFLVTAEPRTLSLTRSEKFSLCDYMT